MDNLEGYVSRAERWLCRIKETYGAKAHGDSESGLSLLYVSYRRHVPAWKYGKGQIIRLLACWRKDNKADKMIVTKLKRYCIFS